MTHIRSIGPLAAYIIIALFASPVLAHEGVAHSTEMEAGAHFKATMPERPLESIKARAQQIKMKAGDTGIELRTDTKMKLQNASSSGEKREIMKGAFEERRDIKKERMASTSALKRDIKSIVRMHGGEIKKRFTLAIKHLNNLLERISSRLDKLAARGVDISSVTALKTTAESAIDKAEIDAKAVADFAASVGESSDRAQVRTEMQAKIKTAHTSIKAAHESVMKVVRALSLLAKDNKVKIEASVSTTTSATTSVQ